MNPALRVDEAKQAILRRLVPIAETGQVALRDALGRILAEDVVSPIDVPQHDNSAMDGYALRAADIAGNEETSLRVAGSALAGRPYGGTLDTGECILITTGAVLPAGCDCVVPQELVAAASDEAIRLAPRIVQAGANCRRAGEDLRAGSIALAAGKVLRPADIGLLASLGIAGVAVKRRLRVAFFSTGDELRSLGQPLDPGCVYDSNRYTLQAMLSRLGVEAIDLGVVRDDPAALRATLERACSEADAIVTSGGVSVGAADYTRAIMAQMGEVGFWKIAMRPGRPMAFGRIEAGGKSAWLFGLPGNPVAVMVSFYLLARDALLLLAGASDTALPLLRLPARGTLRKKPGRTEFQRGVLAPDEQGKMRVRAFDEQGSGILRSMSQANCIIVLEHERGDVADGEDVAVILFDGLI
ncbi:MAG TPA: gephyrin-like molybdotransferase Glp [Burkholderiaceae bacterium]